MSLTPKLNELRRHPHQVILAESAAVLSGAESLDQNFVDIAQVLLACSGELLITGSGTSRTIAKHAAHPFSVGRLLHLSIAERRPPRRPGPPDEKMTS